MYEIKYLDNLSSDLVNPVNVNSRSYLKNALYQYRLNYLLTLLHLRLFQLKHSFLVSFDISHVLYLRSRTAIYNTHVDWSILFNTWN